VSNKNINALIISAFVFARNRASTVEQLDSSKKFVPVLSIFFVLQRWIHHGSQKSKYMEFARVRAYFANIIC